MMRNWMVLAFSACMLAAEADYFYLNKAPVTAADWTNPAFYTEANAPTGRESDIVFCVPSAHLAIAIDGNSAEFSGITNFLNSIQAFKYRGATVTITVPEGKVMTLKRPFYDTEESDDDLGKVLKCGAGELVLDAVRVLNPDSTTYACAV